MHVVMRTASSVKIRNAQIKILLVALAVISWLLGHSVGIRILLPVKKRLCVLVSKLNVLPVDLWLMDPNAWKEENATKVNVYHTAKRRNFNHACVTQNRTHVRGVAERISTQLVSQFLKNELTPKKSSQTGYQMELLATKDSVIKANAKERCKT